MARNNAELDKAYILSAGLSRKMRGQANQKLAKDVEVSHTVSKRELTDTCALLSPRESKSTNCTGFTTVTFEELVYHRPHSPAGESGHNHSRD